VTEQADEECLAENNSINGGARMKPQSVREHRKPQSVASSTIGFRLEKETLHLLVERAARLGESPHLVAKAYVIEALFEAEERVALREAVEQLAGCFEKLFGEVSKLRENLELTARALLVNCGDVSEEEVKKWTDEQFR
jgi:hypothetical protein